MGGPFILQAVSDTKVEEDDNVFTDEDEDDNTASVATTGTMRASNSFARCGGGGGGVQMQATTTRQHRSNSPSFGSDLSLAGSMGSATEVAATASEVKTAGGGNGKAALHVRQYI